MNTRRGVLMALMGSCSTFAVPGVARAELNTVLNVKPFSQSKNNSCWLAGAVIMLQWKNNLPTTELQVAKQAGPNFVLEFEKNAGLLPQFWKEFASSLKLVTEAPQNFTPSGYHNLLKQHGPLWLVSRLDVNTTAVRNHTRVLRGVTGDGTFDGTTAWVLDPDGGRDYQSSMTAFAKEMEEYAKLEIAAKIDLFPQVIHFP